MKSMLIAVGTSLIIASPAFAQDVSEDGWTGEGSMSAGTTTGNTETTDLGIGVNAARKLGLWTTGVELVADYGELDGIESRNRYFLAGQVDRDLSEKLYAFGRTSYEVDEFSGFESRTFVGGGLGYHIFKGDTLAWSVEGGPGFKIDEVRPFATVLDETGAVVTPAIEGMTEESVAFIGASDYSYAFNDNVTFTNTTSILYAQESTQIGNVVAITAALSDALSARFSFDVRHDTNPPMGFEDTDTATRISLVYALGG